MLEASYTHFPDESSIIWWDFGLLIGISVVSLLGSLFVIGIFLFEKALRCFAFEMVVYLSISTMITTITYLFHWETDPRIIYIDVPFVCKAQAFVMIWFEISQFIWTTLIGYSVYENVIHFEFMEPRTTWLRRSMFLTLGFCAPVLFSLFGAIFDLLGQSGKWCWIINTTPLGNAYGMVIYGFIWFLIIFHLIFTFRVAFYLKKVGVLEEEKNIISKYICKLFRYPIIQIICTLPSSINRIVYVSTGDYVDDLLVVSIIFIPLQGLLIAIAYGYNPQVYKALLETFGCCCKKKEASNDESFVSENKLESRRSLYDF